MNALRSLAILALWIVNLVAWWLAILLVSWERVRSPLHPDYLPPMLPLGSLMIALVINILIGFAVRGLYTRR